MTLKNKDPINTFVSDGVQVEYLIDFTFERKEDLQVYTVIDGANSLLELDVDYTIKGDVQSYLYSGAVELELNEPIPSLAELIIIRSTELTQENNLRNASRLSLPNLEDSLDKVSRHPWFPHQVHSLPPASWHRQQT